MDNPNFGCTCASTAGWSSCPLHASGGCYVYAPSQPHPNREPALLEFRNTVHVNILRQRGTDVADALEGLLAKFDELFPDVQ